MLVCHYKLKSVKLPGVGLIKYCGGEFIRVGKTGQSEYQPSGIWISLELKEESVWAHCQTCFGFSFFFFI